MLEFHEQDGRLIATKALIQDPVEAVYGILDLRQATDSSFANCVAMET